MEKRYIVVRREKEVDIAAENLEDLIEKSCEKLGFNVKCGDCRLFVEGHGHEVDDDDYLGTLPPHTRLFLFENTEDIKTDVAFQYDKVRFQIKEYIEAGQKAQKFLRTNADEVTREFNNVLRRLDADNATTMLSERTQDPNWFEDLEPYETTKEQVMSNRCKRRMNNYYFRTRKNLQSNNLYNNRRGKQLIDRFLSDLRKLLEFNKYNKGYFDRGSVDPNRFCNERGLFECGGLWNRNQCTYEGEHNINPYSSKEARIIFEDWNLDHKIELSRSIIPRIFQAINSLYERDITCVSCACKIGVQDACIDTERYYLEIFTRNNLKLVHKVCHNKKKRSHATTADTAVYTVCRKCFKPPPRHSGWWAKYTSSST